MKVAVVELGRVPLDVAELVRKLNRLQDYFEFRVADPVLSIGDPDFGSIAYSFEKLADLAALRRDPTDDYVAAIVSVPLEGNYFSEGLLNRNVAVITTYEADLLMEIAQRTIDKYVSLEIVANLLSLEYQRVGGNEQQLWHMAPLGCIFDFAANKRDMINKIREAWIHEVCKGRLVEANMPNSMLVASETILKWIRSVPVRESVSRALGNPILGFLLGGAVLSSIIEAAKGIYSDVVPLATIIMLAGIGTFVLLSYIRDNYWKQRRKG